MTEAIRCYKKGSDLGAVGASFQLGSIYFYGKSASQDYAAAISFLEKAAKGGHAEAQDLLGWMFEQGNGTPVNDEAAAKWFQAAAAGRKRLGGRPSQVASEPWSSQDNAS